MSDTADLFMPESGTTIPAVSTGQWSVERVKDKSGYRGISIKRLIESGEPFDLISRARLQFMAACDLGPQWKEWATYSTLFYYRDGKYKWPHRITA